MKRDPTRPVVEVGIYSSITGERAFGMTFFGIALQKFYLIPNPVAPLIQDRLRQLGHKPDEYFATPYDIQLIEQKDLQPS